MLVLVFLGICVSYLLLKWGLSILVELIGCPDEDSDAVARRILLAVLMLAAAISLTSCRSKPAPAKTYPPLSADTVRPKLQQAVKAADDTLQARTQQSYQTQAPYEKAAADYDAERRKLGL